MDIMKFQPNTDIRHQNHKGNKLKLSLSFNWAPRHESVFGERRYSSPNTFYLDTTWRWVVSFTPRPLYPQGKNA